MTRQCKTIQANTIQDNYNNVTTQYNTIANLDETRQDKAPQDNQTQHNTI